MRKKLLAVLLAMCMVVSLLPAAALAADHWAAGSIERWTEEGVLDGGNLDPEARMTRAEFAQMLCSLMGYTQTSDTVFSDLPADDPAAEAISKLVKAGVMNGVGGGKVDPNGTLTREQAAVMLCRALDIRPSSSAMSSFKDSASVSSWAAGAMAALTERGMLHGVGGGLLAPGGLVSNGTAAALVDKMVGEYVTEDRTITGEVKGVVLVVKGAKAEIKDATLSDPVVVKDAAATLTNTKADDVVANGGTVTTDAKTTVVNVTLTGEAPKATISGSVAGDVTAAGSKAVLAVKGDVAGSVELKGETPKATIEGKVEGNVTAAGTKPQVEVKGDVAGTVSVGGSDAKVDLKGEVAGGVTVAADATGKPAVTAPKGTEVKNDSNTSASVNGGTVASGDNTTTTTNPSTPGGSTGGSSSGGDSTGGGSTGGGGSGTTTPPATDPDPELPEEKDPTEETPPSAAESHTHVFDEGVTVKEATCIEEGSKKFTCKAAGCSTPAYSYTETLLKTEHAWGTEETGEEGSKVVTCTVEGCGATKPVGHTCPEEVTDETKSQVDEKVIVEATCAVAGSKIYVCKVCNKQIGEAVEVAKLTTHTEVDIPAVAATCTKKGLTAGKKCSVCGTVTAEQTQTDLAAHTLTHTDNKDGETHNDKCSVCDYSKNVNHSFDAGTETKAPTCTEKGVKTFTCSVCKATKTEELAATGKHAAAADAAWKHDATNHWKECATCPDGNKAKVNEAAHSWTDGKCTECQRECSLKEGHKDLAKGTKCTECGFEGTKEETPTTYSITIGTITGGTEGCKVEANPTSAAKDATVTLTVTAAEGYQLKADSLTVKNGENAVDVTPVENATGKYSFTMPAANVTVTAVFEKIEYDIITQAEGVTFTVDKSGTATTVTKATKGDTVTVVADGKTITAVTCVETENNTKTVTVNHATATDPYTFTMPAAKVTVTVTFEETTPGGGGGDENGDDETT